MSAAVVDSNPSFLVQVGVMLASEHWSPLLAKSGGLDPIETDKKRLG
jgi:hypothetical protein